MRSVSSAVGLRAQRPGSSRGPLPPRSTLTGEALPVQRSAPTDPSAPPIPPPHLHGEALRSGEELVGLAWPMRVQRSGARGGSNPGSESQVVAVAEAAAAEAGILTASVPAQEPLSRAQTVENRPPATLQSLTGGYRALLDSASTGAREETREARSGLIAGGF